MYIGALKCLTRKSVMAIAFSNLSFVSILTMSKIPVSFKSIFIALLRTCSIFQQILKRVEPPYAFFV